MGAEVFTLTEADLLSPIQFQFAGGSVVAFSHRCPGKETANEDSVAILPVTESCGVLVIADGMGGERAGGKASAIAIRSLQQAIIEAPPDRSDLRPAILDGIEAANREILSLGIGAATTISVVEIRGDVVRPYHVGDSTIVLVGQRGKIKLETIPHSPVGHALEAGVIDENEAMQHDERHIVTNYLGSESMRIELGPPMKMSPRDTLVISSDGLSDNLTASEIAESIRTGDLMQQTAQLVNLTTDRMHSPPQENESPSKPDDLSILVFRMLP